ncbi:MAG: Cysteine synthase [Clostridia bacterium]|jgi:cysteine synthase A|nr:Cysteine synthase [Clostridia bacterium]
MHYINDIRELIGNTPLLKLNRLVPGLKANLFAKLEYFSPGGSVKDRVGLEILTVSEKQGLLKPGDTIIEATAGNTGIGLAMAAFEKGYSLKLVVPAKFAIEKQVLMRALGAEIIVTPTEDGIEGAIKKAAELAREIPNSFMPRQFDNELNVAAHRKTGKEIYDALDGKIDILVAGAGSGGTIVGIASYLKEMNPDIQIVLSDPIGSILGGGVEGTYHIEGIGNHFVPSIFDSSYIDEVEKISDEEAAYYVQLLGKKEGVLVGSSSGASIAGAIKQAYKANKEVNIVAVLPDRSDRYFSQNLYDFEFNLSDFRFNALFDGWADAYDATVSSDKGEYHEVFDNYQEILKQTVKQIDKPSGSIVLDIGSGTGNLGYVASLADYTVTGVEPNLKMREIAAGKYPNMHFADGTFFNIPASSEGVDAIISSYAFHHLSDAEKRDAAKLFAAKLKPYGKVIIADTMYASLEDREAILQDALAKGYNALANDLQTEFYTTHDILQDLFVDAGFSVTFKQMNKFVWILTAVKA